MLDIDVSPTRIRARGSDGEATTVEVEGWVRAEDQHHEFPNDPVDRTVSGYAVQLRLRNPTNIPFLSRTDGGPPDPVPDDDPNVLGDDYQVAGERTLELPEDSYTIDYQSEPVTTIRFDGEARIRRDEPGPRQDTVIVVSFPTPTAVTIGFLGSDQIPDVPVTVPETISGVATAVSQFSAALRRTDPERFLLGYRSTLPTVEFGDGVAIPSEIRDRVPDTGIEIRLPHRPAAVFAAAPLAFYLGATVETSSESEAAVVAPATGLRAPLPTTQSVLEDEIATLHEHLFALDAAICADKRGHALLDRDLVAEFDLDPEELSEMALADRVEQTLDLPRESVADAIPTWPRTVQVEPRLEHAPLLARIVRTLPHVYTERGTADADGQRRTERTPDRDPGEPSLENWIRQDLKPQVAHLGEGSPATGGQLLEAAFHNEAAAGTDGRGVTVTVVDTRESGVDWDRITDEYGRLQTGTPVDVSVHRETTCERLAELLARPTDVFQFVGPCPGSAFACRDGQLAAADVEDVRASVVLLGGSRTADLAVDLVELGSVAVAGTTGETALGPATTAVKALLVGMTLDAALELGRRFGTVPTAALPVGDVDAQIVQQDFGAYYLSVLSDLERSDGSELGAETGDGGVSLSIAAMCPDPGFIFGFSPYYEEIFLGGRYVRTTIDECDVRHLFEHRIDPVVYDGELYWLGLTDPFCPLV